MTNYVGIDPGKHGGIVLLRSKGLQDYMPMPPTVSEIIVGLKQFFLYPSSVMVVERAQPMPKQGISSTAKYMRHFGIFEAVAACLQVRYIEVSPSQWKRDMGLTKDKNDSIRLCERLFPNIDLVLPHCRKPHDGIAEAALIAEWARRKQL